MKRVRNVEVKLHDNSKLVFSWVRPGLLSIEVWKPNGFRTGPAWLLQSSALLDGEQLAELGAFFLPGRDRAGVYQEVGKQ